MKNENNTAIGELQLGTTKLRPHSPKADLPNASEKVLRKIKERKGRKSRSALALEKIGISAIQLRSMPPLTRYVRESIGNVSAAIEALRFSTDPLSGQFLKAHDGLKASHRKNLGKHIIETVSLIAGMDANQVLGLIIVSFRAVQANKSALKLMAEHPELVKSTVRFAKERGGVADRRMLHEAIGFVPTSKGMSLNFNFPGLAPVDKQGNAEEEIDEERAPDVNQVFPMVSDKQREWMADKQKLLNG